MYGCVTRPRNCFGIYTLRWQAILANRRLAHSLEPPSADASGSWRDQTPRELPLARGVRQAVQPPLPLLRVLGADVGPQVSWAAAGRARFWYGRCR